ncbi:hypothetical protein M758_UG022100 [Ceratodon purpureus]|nr:hypothetical protein M758_UG022100 [Ceratodon purpureus]
MGKMWKNKKRQLCQFGGDEFQLNFSCVQRTRNTPMHL